MQITSYLIRLRQFFYKSGSQLHSNVRFIGRSVDFVNSVDLLGVPLYADLKVNHIHKTQNSELRSLFNIQHEDCNKLVIVTIIRIVGIN